MNEQGIKTYRFSGPGPTGQGKAKFRWDAVTTNLDGTPAQNLGGYKLYLGTEPDKFSHVIDVGNVTSLAVTDLPAGVVHCAVTAYNTAGLESDLSAEAEGLIK